MVNYKKNFLITSTGTGLGKTYVCCQIIKGMLEKKVNAMPLKPILSGYSKKLHFDSDSAKLLRSAGKNYDLNSVKEITPWLFKKPIAPTLAAKIENKKLSYKKLKRWCSEKVSHNNRNKKVTFIEGAGGLMVPIGQRNTFLNLAKELNLSIILVVGSYLGSVSHTLSILKNIEQANLKIVTLIINQVPEVINQPLNDTKELISNNSLQKIKVRKINKNSNFKNSNMKLIIKDIINYLKT